MAKMEIKRRRKVRQRNSAIEWEVTRDGAPFGLIWTFAAPRDVHTLHLFHFKATHHEDAFTAESLEAITAKLYRAYP